MELSCELICASVFTVSCVLVAFAYRYVCKLYTYFDKMDITGPVPYGIMGTWKEALGKFLGDMDFENSKLYGKIYGTFDGLTPNLMVLEPGIIKQILLVHKDKFSDRKVLSCENPTLRKCLETLYGHEDEKVQALTNSLLPESKTNKLVPVIESSVDSLIRTILKRKEDGVGFNFITIVRDFVHELIALTVFGIDLNSDISFRDEFVGCCNQIYNAQNPGFKVYINPAFCDAKSDSSIMTPRALDYFVKLIKKRINDTPKDQEKASSLIEILVEAAEEEKKLVKGESDTDLILTEDLIVNKCLSTILSLSNSAESIVLLAIQCLGNHLEVQEELSHEVKKNKSEKLSASNLQNLQFLDMIIAEVMRLYPSEFRIERVCTDDVTIDKFNFVKGDRVSVPLYALHRQEDYYPEHEKFDPRRFSQEEIENRNMFTYLPFAQARHNSYSIAIRIALLASKISIFKLIEKLQFKAPDASHRVIFRKGLTGLPRVAALNILTEVKN